MKKFYYFLFSGLLLSSCASSEWAFDDTYEKTKNPMAYNFNNKNDVREFVKKEEQRFNVVISYDLQTGFDNIENQYYLNEQFHYYNFQPYLANRNDCYCVYDGTYSRNFFSMGNEYYRKVLKERDSLGFYTLSPYRFCKPFYNSFYTFGTGIRGNIDGIIYRDNFLFAHNFNKADMAYWYNVHTKDYNVKDDEKPNGNGGSSGGTNLNNNGLEFEKKPLLMSQIGLNHPDFVLSNIEFDYNSSSNNNGSIQNAQTSNDMTSNGNNGSVSNNSNNNQLATNPFSINNTYPGSGVAGNYNVSNNPYDKQNGNYDNQAVSTTSNSSATANSRSTSTSRRTSNQNNGTQNGGSSNNNNNGNVYSNKNGNSAHCPNNTSNNNNYGGGSPRSSSGNYSSGGGGTGSNRGNTGGSSVRR